MRPRCLLVLAVCALLPGYTGGYNLKPADVAARVHRRNKRKNWEPWDFNHPSLKARKDDILSRRMPNILFIVADDLGYGDTSVEPFVTPRQGDGPRKNMDHWPCAPGGYLTPSLERLAAAGIRLTNFHAAAPVCSPARASLLTGLFAWRLGALNAFEVGDDYGQRNMFLPQVKTLPEVLREAGYYTGHSGKWHLGGMREEHILSRETVDGCVPPGPNQHGLEDYISMLDGQKSPRYQALMQPETNLHEHGHEYFIKNDIQQPTVATTEGRDLYTVLSDREAQEAVSMIKHARKKYPGQPWYVQLWFNAPHSPWTELRPGRAIYDRLFSDEGTNITSKRTCMGTTKRATDKSFLGWTLGRKSSAQDSRLPLSANREFQYKTMVSAMDRSLGYVLDSLEKMKTADETIVIFTSDNGPERNVGSAGPYREMKRSLLEGGIRVPTIIRWPGKIAPGSMSDVWGAHTDLVPTLLAAVGIQAPGDMRVDGFSLLPLLLKPKKMEHRLGATTFPFQDVIAGINISNEIIWSKNRKPRLGEAERKLSRRLLSIRSIQWPSNGTNTISTAALDRKMLLQQRDRGSALISNMHRRVYLYHRATEKVNEHDDSFGSAVVLGGRYKVVTTTINMCVYRFYDLLQDPSETHNLINSRRVPISNYSGAAVLERLRMSASSVGVSSPSVHRKYDLCPGASSRMRSATSTARGLYARDDADMRYTIENVARFMDFHYISKINKCDAFKTDDKLVLCILDAVEILVNVMRYMITPLRKFVIFGAHGQREYMQSLITKETCNIPTVPLASDIPPMDFGNSEPMSYF